MIEILSSVVNSLTYRVLSHLFVLHICDIFFSNLYILLWQKTMKFVDFFGEIWLNCGWYFLHSLLEHFLEKAYCLYSVWFPNCQKCVYFGHFLHDFVLFFLWDYLRTFSNYLSHVLFFFSSSKIMCFHVFQKRIIMISPSGTASYMTEWWSFRQYFLKIISKCFLLFV